ncbi:IclR family transcriptional regulator [Brevibacillus agri]|uniref:IclR family transcriptional regulator n=1 Tax=Brevibacillus agri TaxID=51101 RepID=UPI002E2324E7|nr:IclR family transcriptional regulator [Brevibacillus agri]MED1656702.1 IclR family transcriptional regulator [Brevibacillus agri]MED1687640.1 IclR family transcriptional regulator [Brevibacillus agri]MED1694220.1 IclR family transcriptional regulator [Brevibacillus agri]MED1696695.1 IclR family transcriptional regulator [Brevibacillus agri]
MSEKFIQSVDRAIDILELFSLTEPELSVKEISDRLKLSKSTVHGLMKTLEHRGYLEQKPTDQKYKLGLRLFELGNLVGSGMELRNLAYPIIQSLVATLQETVHLVVLDKDEVVYVEKVEAPASLRMYSMLGKRAPLYCTGGGKALFAYLDEATVDRILQQADLRALTPFTLTDPEAIKRELQKIREQGYAIDDEEIEIGLKCVAAPIFNHEGKVIASISCAGPKHRFSDDKMTTFIQEVKHAALALSRRFGYRG